MKIETRWKIGEWHTLSNLIGKEYKRFEDIKTVREDGIEFWSARELGIALDYVIWENFSKVIIGQ